MLSRTNIQARLSPYFPGDQERQLNLVLDSIRADFGLVVAWSNALAAKLNADAGVTDTNYVGVAIPDTGI